jgi:hypothetical protein
MISSTFRSLLEIQLSFGSYDVGVVQRTPVPSLDEKSMNVLVQLSRSAWSLKRNNDTNNLTSHAFYAPALTPNRIKQSSHLIQ